jgi:hypothetical protein
VRIRAEEALFCAHFGDEHKSIARTSRLVPAIYESGGADNASAGSNEMF